MSESVELDTNPLAAKTTNMPHVRMCKTLDTNQPKSDRRKYHMSESVELCIQSDEAPKYKKWPPLRICKTLNTNGSPAKGGEMPHVRFCRTVHTNQKGTQNRKLSNVRICKTLVTNRAAARERKCPDVRICRTVHTNQESTKNNKWPHIRICRTFDTNRYSRDSGDPLMAPCGPQEWQNPLDCWSNFNDQENEACCKGWWRTRYFEGW